MDQPLHNYMRLGIVLCVAWPEAIDDGRALERSIEAVAADDFFTVVELRYIPDDDARRHIIAVLRASRLGVVYELQPRLHALALDLNSRDAASRGRAVETAKRGIDEAIELGAERINVVSGRDSGPAGRDGAADALVDSLYELAGYAAARGGPPLALEPISWNGHDRYLIGPTAEGIHIVRLVREVYPTFGLTVDTGHAALLREDVATSFALAAPYLGQLHLANAAPGNGNAAPPFGASGGIYDVPRLAEVLLALFRVGFLAVGRRPLVLLRVGPYADERGEWIIAGAKRALAEAWARL